VNLNIYDIHFHIHPDLNIYHDYFENVKYEDLIIQITVPLPSPTLSAGHLKS
jgi:hypothetical protein